MSRCGYYVGQTFFARHVTLITDGVACSRLGTLTELGCSQLVTLICLLWCGHCVRRGLKLSARMLYITNASLIDIPTMRIPYLLFHPKYILGILPSAVCLHMKIVTFVQQMLMSRPKTTSRYPLSAGPVFIITDILVKPTTHTAQKITLVKADCHCLVCYRKRPQSLLALKHQAMMQYLFLQLLKQNLSYNNGSSVTKLWGLFRFM